MNKKRDNSNYKIHPYALKKLINNELWWKQEGFQELVWNKIH